MLMVNLGVGKMVDSPLFGGGLIIYHVEFSKAKGIIGRTIDLKA